MGACLGIVLLLRSLVGLTELLAEVYVMTSLELSNKHEGQVPKGIWRLFLV